KLCFNATSTETRSFQAGVQGDAARGYKGYSGNDTFTVNKGETLEVAQEFTMTEPDDLEAVLFFSLGKMPTGETKPSTVVISNVSLVKTANAGGQETTTPETPDSGSESTEITENMVSNADFSELENYVLKNWDPWPCAGAEATHSVKDGAITYDIKNVGTADYAIQLKQSGIKMTHGAMYKLSFDVTSTVSRKINSTVLDVNNDYKWYMGGDIELSANETKKVEFVQKIDAPSCDDLRLGFTLGNMGSELGAHQITISNLSLVKIDTSVNSGATFTLVRTDSETEEDKNVETVKNADVLLEEKEESDEEELEESDETEESAVAEESNEGAEVIDENAEDDTEDTDASDVTE
ncbi:MAG: carbohydrate binding domain-containing protein, partial [Pseudobutyrivibrio sp.]|nr:carbohydrate binding domain-containing protein [Pseudobutyrivibrio sp.]